MAIRNNESAKLRVGVIGCGNISGAYFEHKSDFASMEIVAGADVSDAAAQKKSKEYGITPMDIQTMLADSSIDIILNLTIPQAHAEVNIQVLKAGKHVYCEKPFGIDRNEASDVVALATKKGLRVGCAPDTFLGGGLQTSRKLIDDGWIGTPISGTAFMMCAGHEAWHPNPGFYYRKGGGPVLDMGPYYITALVNLLGPVAEVQSMAHMSGERICTSDKRSGEKLPVEVNTHVAGTLRFKQGTIITMVMSFDTTWASHNPIEIHGTNGSLHVPNPNSFGGPVAYARRGSNEGNEVPLTHGYTGKMRSVGLADMAAGIIGDRPHRASGELANHVLDVMLSLDEAARKGCNVKITSTCKRPAPLPVNLAHGVLD